MDYAIKYDSIDEIYSEETEPDYSKIATQNLKRLWEIGHRLEIDYGKEKGAKLSINTPGLTLEEKEFLMKLPQRIPGTGPAIPDFDHLPIKDIEDLLSYHETLYSEKSS